MAIVIVLVILLGSLELPESNVDGDATLALGLQLVHHPGILEGTLRRIFMRDNLANIDWVVDMHLAGLLGLLLELLDGPLVDATALVDQVAGGGRLARVDVADDDDVDMGLFLSHPEGLDLVRLNASERM